MNKIATLMIKLNLLKISGLKFKIRSFFQKEFFRNHIVCWLLILSFLSNLANWIILKIFVKPADFPIILHYNVYFGVDMLGNWKQVFILPALGIALFLTNFFLALFFYERKERIASHLLLLAALMLQLSLIIASGSLIIINY